jgi:hypothetical protein
VLRNDLFRDDEEVLHQLLLIEVFKEGFRILDLD